MNERIEQELQLLRTHFPRLEYREEGRWVLLPEYLGPPSLWSSDKPDVSFQISASYPQKPYAFYVRRPFELLGLEEGQSVQNVAESSDPPFGGEWLKFSWDMPEWRAASDLQSGYNLLNWALSFRKRLEEGA